MTALIFISDIFTSDIFTSDIFTSDILTSDIFTSYIFTSDIFTSDIFTSDIFTSDIITSDIFTPNLSDSIRPPPELIFYIPKPLISPKSYCKLFWRVYLIQYDIWQYTWYTHCV